MTLQQEERASNIDELVYAVEKAFADVTATKLFDNFITLKTVMKTVLQFEGGNDFRIPHIKKQARRKAGNEITEVHCGPETILKANEFIDKATEQLNS